MKDKQYVYVDEEEGLHDSSINDSIRQENSANLLQRVIGSIPNRQARYEVKPCINQQDINGSNDNPYYNDETTLTMTQPTYAQEVPGFKLIMAMTIFTPTFFILFYVPHPIFKIMHFLHNITDDEYTSLQTGYIVFMCFVYVLANCYFYYKYKVFKRTNIDATNKQLNNLFNFKNSSNSFIINPKNLIKILFLNVVSIVGLIDTAFDIVFVALCYGSGVIWLAIIIGILYIYTFFDKVHSTRKLFGIARKQYRRRYDMNLLIDHQKQIQFYSSCASVNAYPIAETLSTNNLKSTNLLRRVLLFEGGHVGIQKLVFMLFKIGYYFMDVSNKSTMINYAIPMNFVCAVLTGLFILVKFRDIKKKKQIDDQNNNGAIKKFESQVTQHCIKFSQLQREEIEQVQNVIEKIETILKKGPISKGQFGSQEYKLVAQIDKLKIRILDRDYTAMNKLLAVLKNQSFIREISFYKVKFLTLQDFEWLSQILRLRKQGVCKVSFKDCTLKEDLIHEIISKLQVPGEINQEQPAIVNDITMQMRVNEKTDFELLYYNLRQIVEKHPINILFEPLFQSNRKGSEEETFFLKLSKTQIRFLGQSQMWPRAISEEYQQIKRLYIVQQSNRPDLRQKGLITFFKDKHLQTLFDQLMNKKIALNGSILDLYNIRDIFTHSFHQERFNELVLRALEDYGQDISAIQLRLINDNSYYEKYGFLAFKLSHLKRMTELISNWKLTVLHLNFSKIDVQNTKDIENVFKWLSEVIEQQSRTLKELSFEATIFDLNSMAEKDFYNSLQFPNFLKIVLKNCKFQCYDAFERFFTNLSDTEDCVKHLEIDRLNSIVSAKGFRQFLQSQSNSLETLILNCVHKNILSRKHHKKSLMEIAKLTNLKSLSLKNNKLDHDRLEVIIDSMIPFQSFQELTNLDLSHNELSNDCILLIYKMLKARQFSLDYLDLSENSINEEGLNLLLKGKTEQEGHPLFKGLLANNMNERNYLANNIKVVKLEQLEIAGSLTPGLDPSTALKSFAALGNSSENQMRILNLSGIRLSQQQISHMFNQYLLTQHCVIEKLDLSLNKLDDNIELMQKFISTSKTLKDLILNDCKLRDQLGAKIILNWLSGVMQQVEPSQLSNIRRITSSRRGELSLTDNQFGEQLFQFVLDEIDDIDGRVQQNHHQIINNNEYKEPLTCTKINLSNNSLTDDAVGIDMLKVLVLRNVRVVNLDLSKNQLGKQTLTRIREFLEGITHCEEESKETRSSIADLAFETLDLSNNKISLLKSASILELRRKPTLFATTVIYTKEPAKQKKEKNSQKKEKSKDKKTKRT